MTKNKNFLLLSLDDDKAKKIANAVNNESGIKILNYLSNKEHATETDISEKLKIPISTVHYNLEQLQKADLIEWEDAHFSQKGKKVKHYKLVSKYIIIAPKHEKEGFLEKIKTLFPAFLTSIFGAGLIYYFSNFKSQNLKVETLMAKSVVYQEEARMADTVMMAEPILELTPFYFQSWFVFLTGAILALLVVLIYSYIKKKK